MSATIALLPVILALALGSFCSWSILGYRWQQTAFAERILCTSLAFPLGAGIVSILHFALISIGVFHPSVSGAIAMLFALACWAFRRRWHNVDGGRATGQEVDEESTGENAPTGEPAVSPRYPNSWMVAFVAIGGLFVVLVGVMLIQRESPYGAWDSWAIWTVKAKYLAAGEPFWRNALDATYPFAHPEYPLFTPSFIAWCWKWTTGGNMAQWNMAVPHSVALLSLFSLAGLTFSTLAILRGTMHGVLGLIAVVAPVALVPNGAALYADVPMAAILTAAAALVTLSFNRVSVIPAALLGGFLASFCLWVKIEGVVHMAALSVALVAASFWTGGDLATRRRRLVSFFCGAMPGLAFVVAYRYLIVSTGVSGIAAVAQSGGGTSMLDLVSDPSRYVVIFTTSAEVFRFMGPLWAHPFLFLGLAMALLGFRGWNRSQEAIAPLIAWGVVWSGYFAIYLIGTHPPRGMINNSLDRLLLHPWPMLVIIVLLLTRTVDDWAQANPIKLSKRDRKRAQAEADTRQVASPKQRR